MVSLPSRNNCAVLIVLVLLLVLVLLAVSRFEVLSFGENVRKSGAAIGAAELQTIESRLSISLPAGLVPLEYSYLGSGIDDSLRAKFLVPVGHIEQARAIVQQLDGADDEMMRSDDWGGWLDLDSAEIVAHREGNWSEFNYGSAVLSEEGGEYYLYLYWFTM